jgi:hypothetical protein
VDGVDIITRASVGTLVFGMLPVVPMTIISALLMIVVSRVTAASRPSEVTLARYFESPARDGLAARATS